MGKLLKYITVRNAIYFFSLIAGWPCVFYLMGWLPHYIVNYVELAIFVFLYVVIRGTFKMQTNVQVIIGIQVVAYFIYSIGFNDGAYLTRIFLILTTNGLLAMQLSKDKNQEFIKVFHFWVLAQAVAGAIGVILVFGGVLQPLFEFREMDFRTGYCFGFFATNTYAYDFIRNAGFYDEPGAMACFGIFALLFNKLYIKNKKLEVVLIIALLSTLSLAYFIQLAAYLVFFYRSKLKQLIPLMLLIYGGLIFLSSYSPAMEYNIFGRMEYNDDAGTIEGDNRSDLFESCKEIFLQHPITGVGATNLCSPEIARKYGFVGGNFYKTLAEDGIVGFIISYLPLFALFGLGRKNKEYAYAAIVLLIGYFQRPYDSTQLLFPLTLYTMLMYAYIQSNGSNKMLAR
jgi:hypothetical protein